MFHSVEQPWFLTGPAVLGSLLLFAAVYLLLFAAVYALIFLFGVYYIFGQLIRGPEPLPFDPGPATNPMRRLAMPGGSPTARPAE